MRQASITSGGTSSPLSSTNCTYSASGPNGPESGVHGGHDAGDTLYGLFRFVLPASWAVLALEKPSSTTALTPSREKTRLATRPATPP